MKKVSILTLLFALVIAHSALAAADTFVIDKAHSSMGFQVRHLFSNVPGKFTDFSGAIHYDEANPEQSSVEVTIKTASVDTGVKMRDDDLRSPNFFDAQKYPEITFKSKSVKATCGRTGSGRSPNFETQSCVTRITARAGASPLIVAAAKVA
jgi:polyisoprenoid-binding protein YceI